MKNSYKDMVSKNQLLGDSQSSQLLPDIELSESIMVNSDQKPQIHGISGIKVKVDLKGKFAYQKQQKGVKAQNLITGKNRYNQGKKFGSFINGDAKGVNEQKFDNDPSKDYADHSVHLAISGRNLKTAGNTLTMKNTAQSSKMHGFEVNQGQSVLCADNTTDLNHLDSVERAMLNHSQIKMANTRNSEILQNSHIQYQTPNQTDANSQQSLYKSLKQHVWTSKVDSNNTQAQALIAKRISKSSQNYRNTNRQQITQAPIKQIKQINQNIMDIYDLDKGTKSGRTLTTNAMTGISGQVSKDKQIKRNVLIQNIVVQSKNTHSQDCLNLGMSRDSINSNDISVRKIESRRLTVPKQQVYENNYNEFHKLQEQQVQQYYGTSSNDQLQTAANIRNKFNQITRGGQGNSQKVSRSTSKIKYNDHDSSIKTRWHAGAKGSQQAAHKTQSNLRNRKQLKQDNSVETLTLSNRYIQKFVGASASAMRARAQNADYSFKNHKSLNNLMDAYRSQLNVTHQSTESNDNRFVFDETNMSQYLNKNNLKHQYQRNSKRQNIVQQLDGEGQSKRAKRVQNRAENATVQNSKGRFSPNKLNEKLRRSRQTPDLRGSTAQNINHEIAIPSRDNDKTTISDRMKNKKSSKSPNDQIFASIDKENPLDQLHHGTRDSKRSNSNVGQTDPLYQTKQESAQASYDEGLNQLNLKTSHRQISQPARTFTSGSSGLRLAKIKTPNHLEVPDYGSGSGQNSLQFEQAQQKVKIKFNKLRNPNNNNNNQQIFKPKNNTILATQNYLKIRNKQKLQMASEEYQYADSQKVGKFQRPDTGNLSNRQSKTSYQSLNQPSIDKRLSQPFLSLKSSIEKPKMISNSDDSVSDPERNSPNRSPDDKPHSSKIKPFYVADNHSRETSTLNAFKAFESLMTSMDYAIPGQNAREQEEIVNARPDVQIKGINRQIKKLLLNANQIVTSKQDLYEEIRTDYRKNIEYMSNAFYCFKVDVRGQMPPLMLKFEYVNTRTGKHIHKDQMANLIDVIVSLSLKGNQIKQKSPLTMKIHQPMKAESPFTDYVYVNINTSEMEQNDILIYLTPHRLHPSRPSVVNSQQNSVRAKSLERDSPKQDAADATQKAAEKDEDPDNKTLKFLSSASQAEAYGAEGSNLSDLEKKKKSVGLIEFKMNVDKQVKIMIEDHINCPDKSKFKNFMVQQKQIIKSRKQQDLPKSRRSPMKNSQNQLLQIEPSLQFEQTGQIAYNDFQSNNVSNSQDHSQEVSFKASPVAQRAEPEKYVEAEHATFYNSPAHQRLSFVQTKSEFFEDKKIKLQERKEIAQKTLERKENLELKDHKRKIFLTHRKYILEHIREVQRGIGIDIWRKRMKIVMWLQLYAIRNAYMKIKDNFELRRSRRNARRKQIWCANNMKIIFRHTMAQRSATLGGRRKKEAQQFFSILGLLAIQNKRNTAIEIVGDLLKQFHEIDRMAITFTQFNDRIIWIQRTYRTNQELVKKRLQNINEQVSKYLIQQITAAKALNAKKHKDKDKIVNRLEAFQNDSWMYRPGICELFHFYMKLKLQLVDYKVKFDQACIQYAMYNMIKSKKAPIYEERVKEYEDRIEGILGHCEKAHKDLGFAKAIKGTGKKGKKKKKLTLVQRMRKLGIKAEQRKDPLDEGNEEELDPEEHSQNSKALGNSQEDQIKAYIPDEETMQKLLDLGLDQFDKKAKNAQKDDETLAGAVL